MKSMEGIRLRARDLLAVEAWKSFKNSAPVGNLILRTLRSDWPLDRGSTRGADLFFHEFFSIA